MLCIGFCRLDASEEKRAVSSILPAQLPKAMKPEGLLVQEADIGSYLSFYLIRASRV